MLLVIGLDGGTFDLAGPWMDAGKLPALARLRRQGLWGELRSTVPPATMPSWTSFMTGVNPGRHGIFDFTRRVAGTYDVAFVNSTFRKAPTIWRMLSDAGRPVAVLGMPGTYPPEPINGCMVSGFDAPVTTRANRSFIHPPELADEVMGGGGFSFADFQEFYVDAAWYPKALERLLQGISAKGRLAQTLLARQAWDCFGLVFGESDTVAHHFWHLHDRGSPRHDESRASAHGDAIERVYAAIDGVIESLMRQVPEAAVLVASDHGFGGAGDRAVHLNRWLAGSGWLRFDSTRLGGGLGLAAAAKRGALRLVPPAWQASLFRSFNGAIANRLESRARFAGIDWSGTRAFSEELNYFPSIWINRCGRDPLGQVADADYDAVCAALMSDLLEWRDDTSGERLVRRVWRRADLYHGPCVEGAPDLVLELEEPQGYSYSVLPSGGTAGPAVRRMGVEELVGGKRFGMSGSHRPNGMYLLAGAGAGAGEARSAGILDMAPTILSLCGMVPPEWMEGSSVLQPAERRAWLPEVPWEGPEQVYGAGDEVVLEERLRALGYIA